MGLTFEQEPDILVCSKSSLRTGGDNMEWSQTDIADLESLYWDSSKEELLSRFYPRSLSAIKTKAKRLGYRRFKRINPLLFDFEKIDTEIKAYFLGYICADACVTRGKRQSVIHFSCSIKDYDYMKLLRDNISPNAKISILTHDSTFGIQQLCRFNVCNSKVANQLIDLGVVPNKSLILKMPEIPQIMHRHFWRGYFDGDGSVSMSKTKKPPVYCQIVGTCEMMSSLQAIFKSIHSNNCSVKKHSQTKNNTYTLRYSGYVAMSFLDWIYRDSTIYLPRKFKLYYDNVYNKGL